MMPPDQPADTASERKVPPYLAEFWNGEGGQRWIRNLARVETLLASLGEALLDRAAPRPGETVLDVGCGGGTISARVAELVGAEGKVLGVDVSSVILDVARKRCPDRPNLEFRVADAATMDVGEKEFDLLVSRMGVMFFADPAAAFANLGRALKPGGRMAFVCWAAREENAWLMAPAAAAFEVLPGPPPPEPGDPGPFSLEDPERIRDILEQGGYRDIRSEALGGKMDLGTLDSALELATRMGPAAKPIEEANPEDAARAVAAVRTALEKYLAGDRVQLPFKAWIVTTLGPRM